MLAALLTLREKVIKPVLAGAGKPRRGPKPKRIHPMDQHYLNLQKEMRFDVGVSRDCGVRPIFLFYNMLSLERH